MVDKVKPITEGDKVLVEAIVLQVWDDDPHDPSLTVLISGQRVGTTVMAVRNV